MENIEWNWKITIMFPTGFLILSWIKLIRSILSGEFCFLLSMLKNDEAGVLKFVSKFLWIEVLSWLLYDENC